MPAVKEKETRRTPVKPGVERYLTNGTQLMTVVIDFINGPWDKPDPMHNHVHEQTTYIAEGEILFFCEGEPEQRLRAGDLFYVPSGKNHAIQVLTQKVRLVDSFNPVRQDFLK